MNIYNKNIMENKGDCNKYDLIFSYIFEDSIGDYKV